MFHYPKKLLIPFFPDGEGDERSAYRIDGDVAYAPAAGTYSAWAAWSRFGVLPRSGGYLAQPLALLVLFAMFDACHEVQRIVEREDGQFLSKFSTTQMELYLWLTN